MDHGRRETERELAALEERITRMYSEAAAEMEGTIKEYFDKFKERDREQKKLLQNREITEEQYKQWRLAQIGRGKRLETMRDELAERIYNANAVAAAYINDATPGVYALNYNYSAFAIERVHGNIGFTLYDEETMRRLLKEDPALMPYYPAKRAVKRGIDLAYSRQQITAAVTSGILQGKSIGGMADDLQKRIENMGRASAVRAARTAITSAENGGRQDSYTRAAALGIKVRKRWMAVKDARTRDEHGEADGQTVEHDEPFIVGGEEMMFPGDPSASAGNLYNCRCTMRTVEKEGIEAEPRQMRVRDPETGRNVLVNEMTYKEWETWKQSEKQVETPKKPATIKGKTSGGGGTVQTIGRIDINKYKVVAENVRTDEVIITDERIQHIKDRHPNDFEKYASYIADIVKNPQYIIEANKPNTAFLLKKYAEPSERFQLILRLAVEKDEQGYKNSVITFLRIEEKRFNRYLRTKKILYKSE